MPTNDPLTPETFAHDVLVIGAGGAGLRAAIEAQAAGANVGLVCKSLLGKAHTVMAEGGVAAAMAHVARADTWQIHFRDTMVGGKLLNNPRMAELHATEAPDRVRELEMWGAVFDRTEDGRILQRPFGGHTHPRLAHVGDRTGLEMIRTLQDRAVASGITVYMECTITRLITGRRGVTGAFGYWRTTGQPILFPAKAIVLATGGIGKAYEVTSNSWEYSGDGQALAYEAGADLIDMEFVQFHPTGMVWPPGVRGLLVTEAVRGEGGILRNADGERFMWKYLPEDRRAEYAATDEEAKRWVTALSEGHETDARRPPELSTRDNVARAIYTEVKEGRGSPHGGVFLDISYLPPDHVRRKLPSMYEQFKELADVDITAGPMEVGPTTHYVMGGIRVDAESGTTTVPGLFAAGEVVGRDARREPPRRELAVRPARVRRAHRRGRRGACGPRPTTRMSIRSRSARPPRPSWRRWSGPRARTRTRSSATSRRSCRASSGSSGSRRTCTEALGQLAELRRRWASVRVSGGRAVQPRLEPGVRARQPADACPRRSPEPRSCGPRAAAAHSRIDFPATDDRRVGRREHAPSPAADDGSMQVTTTPLPAMPDSLRGLLGGGH